MSNATGGKHSLASCNAGYFHWMLGRVPGMKALILDSETVSILSLILNQSKLLEKEVFYINRIDSVKVIAAAAAKLSQPTSAASSAVQGSTLQQHQRPYHAFTTDADRSSNVSKRQGIDGDDNVDDDGALASRRSLKHLKAIFFIRPSADNIIRIISHLRNPLFSEYHLFFSNRVSQHQLERLAKVDTLDAILQVHELYADINVINPDLFSLNIPSLSCLMTQEDKIPLSIGGWSPYEETQFHRIVDGVISALFMALQSPLLGIAYPKNSDICRRLAGHIQQRAFEDRQLIKESFMRHTLASSSSKSGGSSGESMLANPTIGGGTSGLLLLLFDRRDDPVTPLLNQWTYQAMAHELLGVENNRLDLRRSKEHSDGATLGSHRLSSPAAQTNCQAAEKRAVEESEVVLSRMMDPFFDQHWISNFGDLGAAVNDYVSQYQSQSKSTASIESIADMQRFIELYPEFRKLSGNVSKHVTVAHELNRQVVASSLLDVSVLEQDIVTATGESRREAHRQSVLEKLKSTSIPKLEKLRLVLLYSIRYEHSPNAMIELLKSELQRSGVDVTWTKLVDLLLEFAGAERRGGPGLFQNKNFLQIAKFVVERGLKGAPNVYTQHKSLLHSILESIAKGRCKGLPYEFLPYEDEGGTAAALDSVADVYGKGSNMVNSERRGSGFHGEAKQNAHGDLGLVGTPDLPSSTRRIPLIPHGGALGALATARPSDVLVFAVGGTTYEEARDAAEVSAATGCRITLGGTTIHNSKSFLADVAQLAKQTTELKGLTLLKGPVRGISGQSGAKEPAQVGPLGPERHPTEGSVNFSINMPFGGVADSLNFVRQQW